jgi:flagellar hook-length control protein FliK
LQPKRKEGRRRMMTQSIPTQASAIMFGAAGSANIAKRSGEYDFDMLLAGNISREAKIAVKANSINENTRNTNKASFNQSADGKEKITGSMQDKTQDGVSKANSQSVDNATKQEQKDENIISEDVLEKVMTMFDQIKNIIMDELDITPEELDSMMKELGLELSDLTDPKAIISLILADSGNNDPLAMLLDEQLVNKFQSLLAKLEDIRSEANLKLTDEELKMILEQTVTGEEAEVLPDMDDTQDIESQPVAKRLEDEGSKNDNNDTGKLQTVSGDESDNRGPVISAHDDDSQLKDTDDRRAKTDKTDGFEMFLDKLSANYDKPIEDFSNNTVRLYEIRDIAQQIINEIRVLINPEQTTMELQLNPEHLGKVNLTISSKQGAMTAHFAVQNDLAKEAIESQLITLKETLAEQGIKVETIEVTVANYTFDQESPSDDINQRMPKKQKSGHKITFEEAVTMSEEPIEDSSMINPANMGNNIDYTA